VSTAGEVYVWGAISYYAFGNGTQYNRGENCTVPVCIRGVPHEVCTREDSGPDQVALYRDTFATTIARKSVEEEMGSLITSLKTRSSQLLTVTRARRAEAEQRPSDDGVFALEELRQLNNDFISQKKVVQETIEGSEK
ncbi:unnamed protein product, partial [Polarella glacialis]